MNTLRHIAAALAILSALAACSDPQCQSDEVRVGTVCRSIHPAIDGSTEIPHETAALDSSTIHDDSVSKDAATVGDSSLPIPADDNDASLAANADNILDTLVDGPPSFQYRADTVTLRGTKVASIPNRRGPDALVAAAGALEAPTEDALFGGAPTLIFDGTQWLDSNLPASAWKFTHDGSGFEMFNVYAPSDLSSLQILGGTNGVSASPDERGLYLIQNTNGSVRHTIFGRSSEICIGLTKAGALAVNTPSYVDFYYRENEPLEYAAYANATLGATGNSTAAPDTVQDPFAPLRLGARVFDGTGAMKMRWCETLIFPRVLHESERQIVREYIEARYGILDHH